MKVPYWIVLAAASGLLTSPVLAKDGVAIDLPDQRVAVLSVGDLEPASIGSYSVAVFKDRSLMDFEAGTVLSRNGSFLQDDGQPRVKLVDITGDGIAELIVSKLTAGSGNYLEVDALRIDSRGVRLVARVQTMTNHDEVAELKAACRRARCSRR